MKTFEEWNIAYQEQKNTSNRYDNRIYFSVDSGIENIDSIPFALGDVLWIIMSDNYDLSNYEGNATEYGVTINDRWAALYDSYCSYHGWEATLDNITYYKNLEELIKCDEQAKVILRYKEILTQIYPFLKKHFEPFEK
jgi:hypothetical protein